MKVAVIKTTPDTVVDDYGRVMDLAGYRKAISPSRETILKLNLSWSLYYPACSTPPWQLDGALKKLRADGYRVHAVENKTVVTEVWQGARNNRWLPVLRRHGIAYEPLTEATWVNYRPRAETPALDMIFPDGHSIPQTFIGKDVVHLPTMKTHGHTTMTGAIKNAFGGLITERRHHCHKLIHEVLVDLLAIQKEIHPGMFAVMDGTVCGDGPGPRTMRPVIKDYILASADQVAIDAIAAKMMGFDPMSIRYIRMAHDRGLGCGDPGQIDLAGEDVRDVNFGFRTGRSPVIYWDQMLRKGPLSFAEPMMFRTGLFKACVLGSSFYHDMVWYKSFGRRRIESFMKTRWGKLLRQYPKQ